jgi:cytochrome b subunit of formate dehydrogenase
MSGVAATPGPPASPSYERFSRMQRVEHALLIFSFVVLALTGLPQKFANAGFRWADETIRLLGGIEAVRIIHRLAATLLMVQTIYHGLHVAYQLAVRRARLSMLPRYEDLLHAWQALRYAVGRALERPRMGRYTWEEKVEYWSLVWGTLVMILTGFMLWNPIATTRFWPGEFIPAAQVIHGSEAVLAVLAVIVWHGYAVHIRHFNRSMFTGRLGEEQMLEEHPLELEAIQSGTAVPALEPDRLRRRRRVFLPVAAVVALLLLAGVYWFVTFEQTAIPTIHEAGRPSS